MLPQGSYSLSQTKAEWKYWLHGIKKQKVGTFSWKSKASIKLFCFSVYIIWLLYVFSFSSKEMGLASSPSNFGANLQGSMKSDRRVDISKVPQSCYIWWK